MKKYAKNVSITCSQQQWHTAALHSVFLDTKRDALE